jgi:hypothetical protein
VSIVLEWIAYTCGVSAMFYSWVLRLAVDEAIGRDEYYEIDGNVTESVGHIIWLSMGMVAAHMLALAIA